MRLLKRDYDGELVFVTANEKSYDTPYAILSHTWGKDEDEIVYQDILSGTLDKAGRAKINFALSEARKDELHHVWIDTCCINKWNFTELGKAINLMYQWYAQAATCYVYLSDVFTPGNNDTVTPKSFTESRWFSRGWTLQELTAPRKVSFYDRDARFLGTKSGLATLLQATTGVPERILRGTTPLEHILVADRFRWSIGRDTKEPEDKCYCLLGILDVALPLQYGIGQAKAFGRLLDEVGKVHGSITADRIRQYMSGDSNVLPARPQEALDKLQLVLRFDGMSARREAIEFALHGTCAWLLDHVDYQRWLTTEDHPFLWIKGHPGAGKSTLLKYADLHSERLKEADTVQISFYFYARGKDLQKSTIGMYRALICQLLDHFPHLEGLIREYFKASDAQENIHRLKEAFRLMIIRSQPIRIRCFVDALDECDTAEIQDFISSLRSIAVLPAASSRFSVCFASRYYPALSIKDSIELRLDQQRSHKNDLESYVFTHLDVDRTTDGQLMRNEVIARAEGVFLWAVLAVKLINQKIAEGTLQDIQQAIDDLPNSLADFYRAIVIRPDDKNTKRFQQCMQLLLFSEYVLTAAAFYQALNPPVHDYSTPPMETMARFIASASRGLAELLKAEQQAPKVQIIHESVRDYFFREGGLQDLLPGQISDPVAQSHDSIRALCVQHLHAAELKIPHGYNFDLWKTKAELDFLQANEKWYSFLSYVSQHLVRHAEKASVSISQEDFVSSTDWDLLGRLQCTYTSLPRDCWNPDLSHLTAAHVLANEDCVELMSVAAQLGCDLNQRLGGQTPLQVALLHNRWRVAQQLAVYGVDSHGYLDRFDERLRPWTVQSIDCKEAVFWYAQDWPLNSHYTRRLPSEQALIPAWIGTTGDMIARLLSYEVNVDDTSKQGRTALMLACRHTFGFDERERLAFVCRLLELQASVNKTDNAGMTSLMHLCAAPKPRLDLVELLLQYGADVNLVDPNGETALYKLLVSSRFRESRIKVVPKLLQHGASVNTEECAKTSLVAAINGGWAEIEQDQPTVFEQLIEHGAELDRQDAGGMTALMHACHLARSKDVELLLHRGAQVNLVDHQGATALTWLMTGAAQPQKKSCGSVDCRHTAMLELLLMYGADSRLVGKDGSDPLDLASKAQEHCGENMAALLLKTLSERAIELPAAGMPGVTDLEDRQSRKKSRFRQWLGR